MASNLSGTFLIILLLYSTFCTSQAQARPDPFPTPKPSTQAPVAPDQNVESKIPDEIGEIFSPADKGFFEHEWEKAQISINAGVNKDFQIGKHLGLGFYIDYHLNVAPAYIDGFHLRLDQYTANISASSPIKSIGFGANLNLQITFARLFRNKWDALNLAHGYYLNRLPWDKKSALNNLEPGDMVRIEISSGDSVSTGSDNNNDLINSNASIGLSRGALFIADIYRLKNNRMRLRFIGARNEFNGNFSLTALPTQNYFNFGSSIFQRFEQRQVSRWITINPIGAGISTNLMKNHPVDTFMADYIFNLNNDDAAASYEKIMLALRKLKYMLFLNFEQNEDKIGKSLLKLLDSAEVLHKRDIDLPEDQKAVDRAFKGSSTTAFFNTYINSSLKILINIWSLGFKSEDSESLVSSFDKKENPSDFAYNSEAATSDAEFLRDSFKTVSNTTIESIYHNSREEIGDRTLLNPTELTDLIFNKNLDDNNLSKRQVQKAKDYLQLTVPTLASQINWDHFDQGKNMNIAFIRMQFIFHNQILLDLPPVTIRQVFDTLHKLTDKATYHVPDGRYFEIGIVLEKLTHEKQFDKKLALFEKLYSYDAFQDIGPAILLAFLPKTEPLDHYISLTLNAASDNGSVVKYSYGKNNISQQYIAFKAMLSIINDRTYDLRLLLDRINDPKGSLNSAGH